MSCYYPRIAFPSGLTDKGKTKYAIRNASASVDILQELRLNPGSVLVPCGKCKGCRLDYSRQWADRCMLELETVKKAIFLTLTYDDEHIPWILDDAGVPIWQTLDRVDWQKFMKRLRKRYEPIKLRFFMCGEYGEKTLRPHYHAIVFGIGLDDFSDLVQIGTNRQGDAYYKSDCMYKIWSCGHVLLANVTWETCAYVARYVTKKAGHEADYLESLGVQPEFCLMSRKPGIGRAYLDDHPDALDYSCINISTPKGGRKIYLPRYYLKQLQLTDENLYDKIKVQRSKVASDSFYLKLQNTSLDFDEYLGKQELIKKMQTNPLMRNLL